MKQLLVVRHGQTDWNAEGRYQGASDVVLNEVGRAQAREVANSIRERYSVDCVVASPLRRAFETAEIIAAVLGLAVHVTEQFRERDVGVYEGLLRSEARARYPDAWAENITRHLHTAPRGGESILEVGARVMDGLQKLRVAYPGQCVLLVAHGYVARMVFGIVNRVTDEAFHAYSLGTGEVAAYDFNT
jgi:probable phosphoglycerate mutase